MIRLTMKAAGTSKIAAFAMGATIPKIPIKLIAAKAAKTVRTISTERIRVTSRTFLLQARRADRLGDFRNFRISEVSPP